MVKASQIAVCIITYRRPRYLDRLLEAMGSLAFRKSMEPTVRIIVVDNDAEGSAADVCHRHAASLPWPVTYEIEPRRGIPMARNRCLSLRDPDAELLAFIDDDEWPSPFWLDELMAAQRQFDADVVTGPVLPCLPSQCPRWIRDGEFFTCPRRRTGTAMDYFGAGNVMFRREVLARVEAFNERLALTGGEDTHMAMRVRQCGFGIIWADEAVAYTHVPETRTSARWVLQRAYRDGNALTLCELEMSRATAVGAERLLKGGANILLGAAQLPICLIGGRAALFRGLGGICRGVGMCAGVFGGRYEQYRVVHGA